MAYIPSATRAILIARIARYEAMLSSAYDIMDELSSRAVKQYRLDTGEGSQAVTERDIQQQHNYINWLETAIEHLRQRLAGLGVVNLTTHRRY